MNVYDRNASRTTPGFELCWRKGCYWSENFANGVVMGEESRQKTEETIERWREIMDDVGLSISTQKMQYLWFGGDGCFERGWGERKSLNIRAPSSRKRGNMNTKWYNPRDGSCGGDFQEGSGETTPLVCTCDEGMGESRCKENAGAAGGK